MRSSVERRKLQRCVTCYVKSSINMSFAEGNVLDVATCMQCLSDSGADMCRFGAGLFTFC